MAVVRSRSLRVSMPFSRFLPQKRLRFTGKPANRSLAHHSRSPAAMDGPDSSRNAFLTRRSASDRYRLNNNLQGNSFCRSFLPDCTPWLRYDIMIAQSAIRPDYIGPPRFAGILSNPRLAGKMPPQAALSPLHTRYYDCAKRNPARSHRAAPLRGDSI